MRYAGIYSAEVGRVSQNVDMPVSVDIVFASLGVVLAFMTLWWVVSVVIRRTDVTDVAWGLGFVVLAWTCALLPPGSPTQRALVASVLVGIWGTRLAWHIGRRNFRPGTAEDSRYAAMRSRAGRSWPLRSLATVFWLQGGLLWLVGLPLVSLASGAQPGWRWTDVLGVLLWVVGFGFEALGDRQLRAWLSIPEHRGQPLETGLWALTRHPNYFGDSLQWWGIGILAVTSSFGPPALIGPLLMTLLLRYVSGVPLLEKRHLGEPAWEAYRERTPIFVPWPIRLSGGTFRPSAPPRERDL